MQEPCRLPILHKMTLKIAASHALLLHLRKRAVHLLMLPLQGVVVADDAAGLRPVLVRGRHPVRQVAQCRKLLLHVQDVAVRVHALQPTPQPLNSDGQC